MKIDENDTQELWNDIQIPKVDLQIKNYLLIGISFDSLEQLGRATVKSTST